MKNTLQEIQIEIREIIVDNPIIETRLEALKQAGYTNLHYAYVKGNTGLMQTQHLKRKHIFRIQIELTQLKKNYPASWVCDLPDSIPNKVELPF